MAKYYVTSGPKQIIVQTNNEHLAVDTFLKYLANNSQPISPINLGSLIRVSEEGFDKHADDILFHTESVLKQFTKLNGGSYE